jgi:DNA-binding CsgD family transcriptional regulator
MRARVESEAVPGAVLTPAEERILELLPTHLTLAQMGADLFVSRNTAKSQVAAIYRKLLVESRDEAVHRARELGLLSSQPERHAPPPRADERASAHVPTPAASPKVPPTSVDAVVVLAHGRATRSRAGEIRARAREARRASFLLREALHRVALHADGAGAGVVTGDVLCLPPQTTGQPRLDPLEAALAMEVGWDVKPCTDSG